ncbi:MAG: hypothetical protein ABW217_07430 [Polyangiaceae bacterium]
MHRFIVPTGSSRRSTDHRLSLVALVSLSAAFGCSSGGDTRTAPSFQLPSAPTSEGMTPPPAVTQPAGNGEVPAGPVSEGPPTDGPLVNGETDGEGTTPPNEEVPPVEQVPSGELGYPENTGAFCNVNAGTYGGDNANLPNPFAMNDGTIISTVAEWTCRRNEIKKDLEAFEIGVKPEPPEVQASLDGNTLSVQVTTDAGSITLTSNVAGQGSCVVIGMNGTSNLVTGCRQVPFGAGQVVQVSQLNSDQPPDDPYYTLYPELYEEAPYGGTPTSNGNRAIGNYSAWSWGVSRIIDGLEQVKDQLGVDTSKIAVHGCSYAGKMALFAGALDERVALTVAQESGGGGIPSWRLSQDFNQRTGTDVEKIDNTNWSWFKDSMLNPPLNPHSLPHDHHELIAMIAPRALIALGNPTQSWLSDESGYKSLVAASQVWQALGAGDHFGYDFNTTQAHCATSQSQIQSVNAFANRFLRDQDASTSIANPPNNGAFDLNTDAVIDWETPTLQ